VRVEYVERESRELVALQFADALASPLAARAPDALAYVSYFAELLDAWAPDNDANEALFRLGSAVLDSLPLGVPVARVARYFEYWVLRLQGVYPSTAGCPACGQPLGADGARLDREHWRLLCRRCAREGAGLSGAALRFLHQAARVAPAALGDVPLEAGPARELEQVHRRLIAAHLDREPRSARVLRELGA
jgi:DNA repair protein RecO (recombination protein O)